MYLSGRSQPLYSGRRDAIMKRSFFAAASFFIFVSSGIAGAAMTPVSAIDSGANNKFKESVNKVGGSEASSLPATVTSVINILLFVAGLIAVIIIVVGGLRFVTSEGDAASANKAKNSVVYALVGLVLAVLAYAIVNFVLNGLT